MTDSSDKSLTLNDLFPPDEQGVENKIDVERAMGRLSKQEAAVLLFWMRGDSQKEMAGELNVSTRRVRQILTKLWQKLPLYHS